jgi:hypothetical protein
MQVKYKVRAVFIATILMSYQVLAGRVSAAATITFIQSGGDLRVEAEGTITIAYKTHADDGAFDFIRMDDTSMLMILADNANSRAGIARGSGVALGLTKPFFPVTTYGTSPFGFTWDSLIFDIDDSTGGLMQADGTFSNRVVTWDPVYSYFIFRDTTLSDIGADSFHNVIVWTAHDTSDVIRFNTAIPEFSSAALFCSGILGLAFRRSRRQWSNMSCVATADNVPRSLRSVSPTTPCHHI